MTLVCGLASFLVPARAVRAASFTVTRGDDPLPDGCHPGDCSLREAVMAANGSPGSTITVPAGVYSLNIPGTDEGAPNAAIGDLDILVAMTIVGAGLPSTTVVQTGAGTPPGVSRIFDNHSLDPVAISGMLIRNGYDVEGTTGGCIRNKGVLTLDAVDVQYCESPADGGGIASYHRLTIRNSRVDWNVASNPSLVLVRGGGLLSGAGPLLGADSTVEVVNTSISFNRAAHNADLGTGLGGGFANAATLHIRDSSVDRNQAADGAGGLNTAMMTVHHTQVSLNFSSWGVGGILNEGTATIDHSMIQANMGGYNCGLNLCTMGHPGGLLNAGGGTLNLNDSSVLFNTCTLPMGATTLRGGGGILNESGMVTISNGTIVSNSCALGGGIAAEDTVTLKNSIVSNNESSTPGDFSGTLTSGGYNLIYNPGGGTVVGDVTGNLVGVDPLLRRNTDPSVGFLLDVGSPAIDAADPGGCRDHLGTLITRDERGYPRPAGGRCDMGAMEMAPSILLFTLPFGGNASLFQIDQGKLYVHQKQFLGPIGDWTAESYFRNPDRSYAVLWSRDSVAYLQTWSANDVVIGGVGFGGPGPGWKATSYFRNPDGSYHLLWTADNLAHVWTINADHTFGAAFGLSGPGPGWRATSYFHAPDGTHRVLWTSDNVAHLWTITPSLGFGGAIGLGGPGAGWRATSYYLNGDGSWNVLWTQSSLAHIWTINADGTFGGAAGASNPPYSGGAQSYSK
jgi:hypothetical protein